MADQDFALGLIAGLIIGIFVGLPCGYVIAQALKPKEDSIVSLERDVEGRITAIIEKSI